MERTAKSPRSGGGKKKPIPRLASASMKKVTFGAVTVEVPVPSSEEVARNVKAGQAALARAKKLIITPGVKLNPPKGVPLFHADPDRPGCLVRVLNGKSEHGTFVGGKFVKTA